MAQAQPVEVTKPNHVFTIIVNADKKEWRDKTISFEEVVKLAYGEYDTNEDIVYKVTWQYPDGSGGRLVKGKSVEVKDRMVFNVSRAHKS